MNEPTVNCDGEMENLIDRLPCGELDETARNRLLEWLEADPSRWRLCGLAFLEAQTWSQSLGSWQAVCEPPEVGKLADWQPAGRSASSARPLAAQRGRRSLLRRLLVATSIVVAFGTGLLLRDLVSTNRPAGGRVMSDSASTSPGQPSSTGAALLEGPNREGPLLASVDIPSAKGQKGPSIHIPVMPADSKMESSTSSGAEIPDYVRQQCERRGYKVSLERRYLFGKLPDGRPVVVPFEQLQLNPLPLTIN